MTTPESTAQVQPAPQKSSNMGTTCLALGCIGLTLLCSCCSIVMLLFGNAEIDGDCLYKGPLYSPTDYSSPCGIEYSNQFSY